MSGPLKTEKTLAILPFRFHRGKQFEDETLGDGIADSLATRLYDIKGLEVRPPSSVRKSLAEAEDSFAAGKLLQVDYILEGSIFPGKDRKRFTVQLLNIHDRSVLWAAQFDEKGADVFQLEDRISERIAKAVQPLLEVSHAEPVTDSHPVQNTDEVEEVERVAPENEPEMEDPVPENSRRHAPAWRYPLVGLLILVVAAAVGGWLFWRGQTRENRFGVNEKNPKILIVPFQNAGARPADVSIGAGLAETLTRSLGNTKKLFVLSANAGRDAAKNAKPVPQIRREFNADYLLRGDFRREGENGALLITAEFVETAGEKALWAKEFRSEGGDISSLNAQIVDSVLETLSVEISPSDEREVTKKQTDSGLAYEIYLAGRYQMNSRSHQGLHKAIESFSQAVEKDPNFALAYVGLADAYALENTYEIPAPPDAYQNAERNVLRALELDQNLAEAHATLAYILFFKDHDRQSSEREFMRAIELNPSYATTHHWFGLTLAAMGRRQESVEQIGLAQKLDPQSAIVSTAKGMIQFYARQYGQGIAECEKVILNDPGFVPAHKTARWIHQAENNYSAALAAFQKERSFSGGGADSAGWLLIEAQVEAMGQNKERARLFLEKALADDFVKQNPKAYAYETALAYAFLGETEKAIDWLEAAEASRNHSFNFVEVDPRLDKVRSNNRYLSLLKKAGRM